MEEILEFFALLFLKKMEVAKFSNFSFKYFQHLFIFFIFFVNFNASTLKIVLQIYGEYEMCTKFEIIIHFILFFF